MSIIGIGVTSAALWWLKQTSERRQSEKCAAVQSGIETVEERREWNRQEGQRFAIQAGVIVIIGGLLGAILDSVLFR